MPSRKINFSENEYYHLYNRGNSKQVIFLDNQDRDRFVKLLYLCNSKNRIDFSNDIVKRKISVWEFEKGTSIVSIGAWVLMTNHFHIYISPKTEVGLPFGNNVTGFMQRVLTSYSKYFNTKYKRTGSLFEGNFKSTHIENNEQAKYLFSYIHLNPIKQIEPKWKEKGIKDKNKALEFLDSYKWSSYSDYMEEIRPEGKIIDRINFLNYFDTKKDFQYEIFDWINIKEN